MSGPLFQWQEIRAEDAWPSRCSWCDTGIVVMRGPEDDEMNTQRRCECPLCGWHSSRHIWLSRVTRLFDGTYLNTVLKRFGTVDTLSAAVREITSIIEQASLDALWAPRLLDDVVVHVLRAHALESVLTLPAEPAAEAIVLVSSGPQQAMVRFTGLFADCVAQA